MQVKAKQSNTQKSKATRRKAKQHEENMNISLNSQEHETASKVRSHRRRFATLSRNFEHFWISIANMCHQIVNQS